MVPLPLKTACAIVGVSWETARRACERGDLPDVQDARSRGVALCLDMAAREPKTRMWWDLAVTLEPRELHLPNRVHLGGDAEAPPVAVQAVAVSIIEARVLARDDYTTKLGSGEDEG